MFLEQAMRGDDIWTDKNKNYWVWKGYRSER